MIRWLLAGVFTLLLIGCNLAQSVPETQSAAVNLMLSTATPDIPASIPGDERPDPVAERVRAIYAVGQALGNHDGVFAKVGDSITVSRHFLYPFGIGQYNLGAHDYLAPTVTHYAQTTVSGGNSFSRRSIAAAEGWAAWAVLNPAYSDHPDCHLGETLLACEYRLLRPSVALIMFGTNDVGYRSGAEFRDDMTAILRYSVENGVIPVVSTIPNRRDRPQHVRIFNDILHDLTTSYHLPLIDYYALTITLPDSGLTYDGIHPSSPTGSPTSSAFFNTTSLQYGYPIRNLATLQALMVIDSLLQQTNS